MHHAMDLVATDQAVLATEGKVADHVQEDTSTHLDGEIKEEGANDVETVGEGPSNSEHQDGVDEGPSDGVDEGPSDGVDEGPSDGVDEGPSDGVDEGPSDSVDEGPSDGVDEGPSGGVNDSVNEGPCDGVDERPSDEGPSDGPSDESDSSSVDDTDLAAGAIVVPDFKNNPDQDDIFATPWEKEHYLKYFPRQTRPSDRVECGAEECGASFQAVFENAFLPSIVDADADADLLAHLAVYYKDLGKGRDQEGGTEEAV
eukprot:Em0051g16a